MSIRLDDIDYFLAVARFGKVRSAADELGVSQPAVTKGVQRLEQALGFPLFTRGAKGMVLTPVAEQFQARTQSLRANLGDAIKEAADLHLGAMGLLRVGVSPLYVQQIFVPACLQLHAQRPAARIKVSINLNDALLKDLQRGDIDLSINALPSVMPEAFHAESMMRDDLCLVVRSGHPLLSRRRLRLADLASADWMLPGPDVAARRAVEGRFSEAGLPPPRVAIEPSTTATSVIGLVRQSDLISLMSESSLRTPVGEDLAVLPMDEGRFERTVGFMTRRGIPLPPLAQRFLEILKEQAGVWRSLKAPARKRASAERAR